MINGLQELGLEKNRTMKMSCLSGGSNKEWQMQIASRKVELLPL